MKPRGVTGTGQQYLQSVLVQDTLSIATYTHNPLLVTIDISRRCPDGIPHTDSVCGPGQKDSGVNVRSSEDKHGKD